MEKQTQLQGTERNIQFNEIPQWMIIVEEIIRRKTEAVKINDAKVLK